MQQIKIHHITCAKHDLIAKALVWASSFSHAAYYAHNDITYPQGGFHEILAVGCKELLIPAPGQDRFNALRQFHQNDWAFGYLGYDLKNDVEKLSSKNKDLLGFQEMAFFKAEHLLFFQEDSVEIHSDTADVFAQIMATDALTKDSSFGQAIPSVNRDTYLATTQKLREHIEEGDCYEINYCQEFHGEINHAHPVSLFLHLTQLSPKPFAVFQKWEDQYILCASPERFMRKEEQHIISQPIKGTRPRGKTEEEDQALAHELRHDEKELAENMMIVDLVRNDLARTAEIGSVKVEEIFGIYPFQQVYQMISTISSQLRPEVHFTELIRHAFPMGSMTGAPKVKVMELIEAYEPVKRGVFSGAAGYITPNGDFDFNVLIRSLFLDLEKALYSFQVGSAITYDAIPESEYEECLLKATAIAQVIGQEVHQPTVSK